MRTFYNTIRGRLVLTFSLIFILFFSVVLWTISGLQQIKQYKDLKHSINRLDHSLKEIGIFERDFFKYEYRNPDFLTSGKSKYLDSINQELQESRILLNGLSSFEVYHTMRLKKDISEIENQMEIYTEQLHSLASLLKAKGHKDWGVIGRLRNAIHTVEEQNLPIDKTEMLMLRRHEKDYLLRKELKYAELFSKRNQVLIDSLKKLTANTTLRNQTIKALNDYQQYFDKMVTLDRKIGLSDSDGMMGELHRHSRQIDHSISTLIANISENLENEIQHLKNQMLLSLTVIFLSLLAIIIWLIEKIDTPIKLTQEKLKELSKGRLVEKIDLSFYDSLHKSIFHSVNKLIVRNRNISRFAGDLSKNKFKSTFRVYDVDDHVGKSLKEMHEVLLKRDKELQIKEQQLDNCRTKLSQLCAIINEKNYPCKEDMDTFKKVVSELNFNCATAKN